MNNAQVNTGKTFNLSGLKVVQVAIEPCFRLVAIGKGIPQYCKCESCAKRGDIGRIIKPV